MELKRCKQCHNEYPITTDFFYFRNDGKINRKICKNCIKFNVNEYRKNNKIIIKQNKKDYYLRNKEILSEKRKIRYLKNKDKEKQSMNLFCLLELSVFRKNEKFK